MFFKSQNPESMFKSEFRSNVVVQSGIRDIRLSASPSSPSISPRDYV